MIDDFTAKLGHALKAAELSRTRLAKLAGVDKSVASRWVSGSTQPSEANLEALTVGLGDKLPGLKLADWSRPLNDFVQKFSIGDEAVSPQTEIAHVAGARRDRPSIAVLPFTNMSGDPDQEFFGDGIAEDILTALSKLRWLFVVGRNSTFAYKGKTVDTREVSQDLDVRYVLEGSVRRSGRRVRVTGQLVDATTGAHVWADRYDRELNDIFAVQDEIVNSVITAIAPAIVDAERQRAFAKPHHSLDAWEAYQRGLWHHSKRDAAETEIARKLFQQAITLDPNFAPGYLGLSLTHITDAIVFLNERYDDALRKAEAHARKAVALDEASPTARANLGYVFRLQGLLDQALREAESALAVAPSSAEAHGLKGVTLIFLQRYAEGERSVATALALGPRDPRRPIWRVHVAIARYLAKDYAGALEAARVAAAEFPSYPTSHQWLAAALGQLGRREEARVAVAEMLRLSGPAQRRLTERPPFMCEADFGHLVDGLRKAGWKE